MCHIKKKTKARWQERLVKEGECPAAYHERYLTGERVGLDQKGSLVVRSREKESIQEQSRVSLD